MKPEHAGVHHGETSLRIGSLSELLVARSADDVHGFLEYRNGQFMSFANLFRRAEANADAFLRGEPSFPIGRVVVPTYGPLDFVVAFFSALLAGAEPIPVPAPSEGHPRNRARVAMICESLPPGAPVLLPEASIDAYVDCMPGQARIVGLPSVAAPPSATGSSAVFPRPRGARLTDRYWQYTSGTSGTPKPRAVTGRRALAQLEQARLVYEEDSECVAANWVPLYHDMGLVTSILRPLFAGYTAVLLDAQGFVRRPATWLEAIDGHRATHISAPDFGYALCARKSRGTEKLDLRSVRVARVAGELVRSSTLRDFTRVFERAGFRYEMFAPSYGLAEAVLTVTTCAPLDTPRVVSLDRESLRLGAATPIGTDRAGRDAPYDVVSCGNPLPGTTVRIARTDGTAAIDGEVGEVHIAGPQVLHSAAGGANDFGLATGDLGFVLDGELFLLGRSMERFQVCGENFYLTDLERIAQSASCIVRPGRVRVDPIRGPEGAVDGVNVLAELVSDELDTEERARHANAIVAAIAQATGLRVAAVDFVRRGALALTSSGKVRRGRGATVAEYSLIDEFNGGALCPPQSIHLTAGDRRDGRL